MNQYEITASALTAQRLRMNTVASNLANANTTRQADGTPGAYRRRSVVFAPLLDEQAKAIQNSHPDDRGVSLKTTSSGMSLTSDGHRVLRGGVTFQEQGGEGVKVVGVVEDMDTPMKSVYDPSHPDADASGYVQLPNINPVHEMIDLIAASRAYEANVTAFQSFKSMEQATLDNM